METLLKEFDPNSYLLDITVVDASGRVSNKRLGKAIELSSLKPTSVEQELGAAAVSSTNVNNNIFRVASASTNVNNNVFKAASTNVSNNVFRAASTNVSNNIFVNERQAAAALELNSIFEMNTGMRPLSIEDRKKVETLLKEFDPNSYSLDVTVVDASGRVSTERMGKAVGLSSLKQTSVEQELGAAVSSTNVNNNIFRVASTNVSNNVFRVASTNVSNNVFKAASTNVSNNVFKAASTNVSNNVFVNERQAAAALELNEILSKSFENK